MNKAVSSEQKPLDVICLGRVAVDLYGQQYRVAAGGYDDFR